MSMLSRAHPEEHLYPAYKANVHERRLAARFCRALPVLLLIGALVVSAYGVFREIRVLLFYCAVLNTWFWLYLVTNGMFSIFGARATYHKTESLKSDAGRDGEVGRDQDQHVVHLIVLPNYKEDEAMLSQTLKSLSEAVGSAAFHVQLAMEEREAGAKEKAERLVKSFGYAFARITFSLHPPGQVEEHSDGSCDDEVPGKASNLKWAVSHYKDCERLSVSELDKIVVTVADADCIFHPSYFSTITEDFVTNCMGPQSPHRYYMWQAPQLPFRNFWASPLPSRIWGYMASVDEFGGVSSLSVGGHHMVFSAYSLTMRLAVEAAPWQGDVVAEDHHCYLACFFYSLHAAALARLDPKSEWAWSGITSALSVRPVYLPVKSTSVASPDGELQGWIDRWHQARRHSQGVSEFSYALLATWDLLCTLPGDLVGVQLLFKLFRAIHKLFCMHILPIIQGVGLGILSLNWIVHKRNLPYCPDHIELINATGASCLCGLAGAWVLVWPLVVPMFLFVISNYLFMLVTFVRPGEAPGWKSIWHAETGGRSTWCSSCLNSGRLALLLTIAFEVFVPMVAVAVPFSFLPEVLAFFHVCFAGNRITYVTATKELGLPKPGSGSTGDTNPLHGSAGGTNPSYGSTGDTNPSTKPGL